MSVTPPAAPDVEALDDGFTTVIATIRGTRYKVKELSAGDYQKCLDKSKTRDEDLGIDRTNEDLLARLMLDKAVVEPDLSAAQIFERPTSVVRKLNDIVNRIHFTSIETDEEKAEREDDKGEAKG